MSETEGSDGHFLRVRGLPWTATKTDITTFFENCEISNGEDGIHMTLARGGRPSGECYIEFVSEDDKERAFKKHRQNMGHRYVEIFKSERSEMEWVTKKNNMANEGNNSGYLWLRGIPYGCSKEEIAQFFSGLKIVPNGITLPVDETGRSTGEAYVQFASKEIAEKAMGKHKEKIGHRYIEIFQSSQQEVRNAMVRPNKMKMMGGGRPGPYSRDGGMGGRFGGGMNRRGMRSAFDDDMYDDYGDYGGRFGNGRFGRVGNRSGGMGGGFGRSGGMGRRGVMGGARSMQCDDMPQHNVHMRGLPFRATEQDIADFFKPIPIVDIILIYGNDGRASGKANVSFPTHQDALKAMKRDKQDMQHRYVELFLESEPGPDDDFMASDAGMADMGGNFGGGGGGGGGMGARQRMARGGGGGGGGNAAGSFFQANRVNQMQDDYNNDGADQFDNGADQFCLDDSYGGGAAVMGGNNGYQASNNGVYQTNAASMFGETATAGRMGRGGNRAAGMGGGAITGMGGASGNIGAGMGGGAMTSAAATGYNQGYTEF